jgi:hypothetical protein
LFEGASLASRCGRRCIASAGLIDVGTGMLEMLRLLDPERVSAVVEGVA